MFNLNALLTTAGDGTLAAAKLLTNGNYLAFLGAMLAVIVSGIGSSIAVGRAGQASAGLLSKDPSKFGNVLVLQLLPATQGMYGFVIAFMAFIRMGVLGNGVTLTYDEGLAILLFCLPSAIIGLVSAIFQGKVAVAGINLIGKQEGQMGHAMTMAVLVEIFAILSFAISFLGVMMYGSF